MMSINSHRRGNFALSLPSADGGDSAREYELRRSMNARSRHDVTYCMGTGMALASFFWVYCDMGRDNWR